MQQKNVVWFSEVDRNDGAVVGGKGANLGEMVRAGIPVPDGFIVTAHAYFSFIKKEDLQDKIRKLLRDLDVSDSHKLTLVSKEIKDIILHAEIPKDIADDILRAYLKLGKIFKPDPLVAIRSSATAEDLPDASFAGQQETFLNVRGDANVVRHVRMAWASLFTPRAIFYRVEKKFDHFKVGIAVPVQKMVQAQVSGVMFTIDPINNVKNRIVVEAIYGLGELIVQGAVTPDHFAIDKRHLKIIDKQVNQQEKQMILTRGKTKTVHVPHTRQSKQKVTDDIVLAVARLGKKLEKHYYFPQDVEWAVEDDTVYVTQTRPVTTMTTQSSKKHTVKIDLPVLASGDPASPGVGMGPAKIAKSARDIRKVQSGDVLVAPQTNPDYVPVMRKVAAIVTEHGGRTSHAAIVSRELGIPAVVGVSGIIKQLKDGQIITVDGAAGKIYSGGLSKTSLVQIRQELAPKTKKGEKKLKTATRVYVNLAESSRVDDIAARYIDGVGLLRAEFMIAEIGTHPKKFIHDKKTREFSDTLANKLAEFCHAFHPRPVVYRATDFKTNEYQGLQGGKAYEPQEANPMMGYRGAFRYVHDPQVFELELAAIKRVRNKKNLKNLWLMIPYVHTPQELLEVKKIVGAYGLRRGSNFKLWMMVEIPVNVILIEEFLAVGIDGISIGSNDLTQLTLGVDRDNATVAGVFDERNKALDWSFKRVIAACHKHRVTASICGQAPSDYPELVERLVAYGITSVSVNPDMVESVRETIHMAEHKRIKSKKND